MTYRATIERLTRPAIIDIQGEIDIVAARLASVRLELPAAPGRRLISGAISVIRTGPRRWLVLAPASAEERLVAALDQPDAPDCAAVATSDSFAGFRISGPDAADIIAQATSLDVHPESFGNDGATFTDFFGQKALVIRCPDGFECHVDASYGDFIADFLSQCVSRRA